MDTKIYWNKIYEKVNENDMDTIEIIKKEPEKGFPPDIYEMIKSEFDDLNGVNILVPSSGDNIAAFSLHLLGANVTSTDISDIQIKKAQKIAKENNWNINFMCCDSILLEGIDDNKYDLVYTSNGVHIWIKNLTKMYQSFYRVLKKEGLFIFFETHPIIRPFNDSGKEIKIIKPYDLIGPFHYDDCGDEYKWRIEDFIKGLLEANFTIKNYMDIKARPTDIMSHNWFYKTIKELKEDQAQKFDWEKNPWAALPQWIGCKVQKEK